MTTINRKIFIFISVLFLFIGAAHAQAQDQDFQSWWELGLKKELSGKLELNGELEQRFSNNSLQFSRSLVTLATSYDLLDFLNLSGGVRTIFVMDPELQTHAQYRFHFDLSGSYQLSGFDLALRTRIQYGFDELLALRFFRLNSTVNRNKLKVNRHIFGTRFDCFATLESFHSANNEKQWLTYAMRYSAGLRFRPNFHARFSLRYILEDEFNVSNPDLLHIVVLGYSHIL